MLDTAGESDCLLMYGDRSLLMYGDRILLMYGDRIWSSLSTFSPRTLLKVGLANNLLRLIGHAYPLK